MSISRGICAVVMGCLILAPWSAMAAGGGAAAYLKKPDAWFATPEAREIATHILSYQSELGGWPKNTDTVDAAYTGDRKELHPTFDNGATTDELRFLARCYRAAKDQTDLKAFTKGLAYILQAQYPNGGWPQYFPPSEHYHRYITFNDGAIERLMIFLREVNRGDGYDFVPAADRRAAGEAFDKGIDCILKCQIRVDGKPTVWCAQHDEKDFSPRNARAFELASFSGSESVGITRLLMSLDQPSPEIIAAIDGAVAWFGSAKLTGIRLQKQPDPQVKKGTNLVVVEDPAAPPLWARFYDLKTGKPFFCDRDGVPKAAIAEIGSERRNGYSWYGTWPKDLLEKEYPAWQKRRDAATAGNIGGASSSFQAEADADFVVNFSTDGKLDIGIGRRDEEGLWDSISFVPDELKGFFDGQKHKESVLVIIAKNVWTEASLQSEVEKLRGYFLERGFKRILIQLASGGLERRQLLDHRAGETAK